MPKPSVLPPVGIPPWEGTPNGVTLSVASKGFLPGSGRRALGRVLPVTVGWLRLNKTMNPYIVILYEVARAYCVGLSGTYFVEMFYKLRGPLR